MPARHGRREDLEIRLAQQAHAVRFRDARHGVSGCRIVLASVIEGAVGLDVSNRHDRSEAGNLVGDKGLDLISRERSLHAAKSRVVVVTGMRPDLDSQLPAAQRGCDRNRYRPRMRSTSHVGAVHETEDFLIRASTLTEVGVHVHSGLRGASPLRARGLAEPAPGAPLWGFNARCRRAAA